jgi:hypothetical protein
MVSSVKREELPTELYARSCRLRRLAQLLDKGAAFDHEVWPAKRDFRHSPVREQLESVDLVDNRFFPELPEGFPHSVSDYKGARRRVKPIPPFKNARFVSRAGE